MSPRPAPPRPDGGGGRPGGESPSLLGSLPLGDRQPGGACSEVRGSLGSRPSSTGAPRFFFYVSDSSGDRQRERKKGKPIADELRQFLAVDHSARASMKNAASCEN